MGTYQRVTGCRKWRDSLGKANKVLHRAEVIFRASSAENYCKAAMSFQILPLTGLITYIEIKSMWPIWKSLRVILRKTTPNDIKCPPLWHCMACKSILTSMNYPPSMLSWCSFTLLTSESKWRQQTGYSVHKIIPLLNTTVGVQRRNHVVWKQKSVVSM